jgi:hypothetical protein
MAVQSSSTFAAHSPYTYTCWSPIPRQAPTCDHDRWSPETYTGPQENFTSGLFFHRNNILVSSGLETVSGARIARRDANQRPGGARLQRWLLALGSARVLRQAAHAGRRGLALEVTKVQAHWIIYIPDILAEQPIEKPR